MKKYSITEEQIQNILDSVKNIKDDVLSWYIENEIVLDNCYDIDDLLFTIEKFQEIKAKKSGQVKKVNEYLEN
jgi:hypothetical protein